MVNDDNAASITITASNLFGYDGTSFALLDLGIFFYFLSPLLLSLNELSAVGRLLVVPKFFHLIIMEATFKATALTKFVPQHNPV